MKMRHQRKRGRGRQAREFKFWRDMEEVMRRHLGAMQSQGMWVGRWNAGLSGFGENLGSVTGRLIDSRPEQQDITHLTTRKIRTEPQVVPLESIDFSDIELRILGHD